MDELKNRDHLPECLVPIFDDGRWLCICNQLYAYGNRVREETLNG